MCVCLGRAAVGVAVSKRFLGFSPNTSRRHDTIITLSHTCTHAPRRNDMNLQNKMKTFKAAGGGITSWTGALDCSQASEAQSVTQKKTSVLIEHKSYQLCVDQFWLSLMNQRWDMRV